MNQGQLKLLRGAALDRAPVNGHTHKYYRYPARFSPVFIREVIETFSAPGDLVFDPFMGSGTALVEARILGRRAIGSDVSSLAVFLSRVKTRMLSERDTDSLRNWIYSIVDDLGTRTSLQGLGINLDSKHYTNMNGRHTWRYRKLIKIYLAKVRLLQTTQQQEFARCVLLRSAQWAIDGRRKLPSIQDFKVAICSFFDEMIEGMREYRKSVNQADKQHGTSGKWRTKHWKLSLEELAPHYWRNESQPPDLVVTSPPYPGVHMLYHRWQVYGRRETPLPFTIANCEDGAGVSFYTMGGRHETDLRTYYEKQYAAFNSLAKIISNTTHVVQMVGFSKPSWQLARFLETMTDAGFQEIKYDQLSTAADGRLWREVPNRKWHADQKGNIGSSREVVLFHKLSNR